MGDRMPLARRPVRLDFPDSGGERVLLLAAQRLIGKNHDMMLMKSFENSSFQFHRKRPRQIGSGNRDAAGGG